MKSLTTIILESVLWPEEVGQNSDGMQQKIDKAVHQSGTKVQSMKDYEKRAKNESTD